MQRDLDLIREILLEVETHDGASCLDYSPDSNTSPEKLYNARLVVERGMVHAITDTMGVGMTSLTWAGHDFLDAVRDDTVWSRTKERVGRTVGSATLEVVKGVAEGIARGMILGS